MESMKVCKSCLAPKPESDFYSRSKKVDTPRSRCKACLIREDRERRQTSSPPNRSAESVARQRVTAAAYRRARKREHRAWTALRNAVTSGKIVRPIECESCGRAGKVQGHHDDYGKPLEVRWLCARCHQRLHVEMRCEMEEWNL